MRSDSFFAEQKEQSKVKTAIVQKYFAAWAGVIIAYLERRPHLSSDRIAYVDLFAGPGHYQDGTPSTAIVVLQEITQDEKLARWVVAIFNDADPATCERLREAIEDLPHIDALRYKP